MPYDRTDIAMVQDETGYFDIAIEGADLKSTEGLDTALYVSIYTDARATENQIKIPENRRGWLGNVASPVEERQLGGYFWMLEQRRLTQETLNAAIDYARQSLAWMDEDGICERVDVTGEIISLEGIRLKIDIITLDGLTETRYLRLWEHTRG